MRSMVVKRFGQKDGQTDAYKLDKDAEMGVEGGSGQEVTAFPYRPTLVVLPSTALDGWAKE
jgi:hypothetical protein